MFKKRAIRNRREERGIMEWGHKEEHEIMFNMNQNKSPVKRKSMGSNFKALSLEEKQEEEGEGKMDEDIVS